MQYIVIIAYILFASGGLICFKLGTEVMPIAVAFSGGAFSFQISWKSIIGILCYVLSFFLNLLLVSKHNLSYITPITTGLVYLIMFLSAVFLFKETVSITHVIGSALILIGVVLINIK